MTVRDVGTARAVARKLVRQVVQDASFAESLRSTPRETLVGAGLPDWAVDDFLVNDLGFEPDVQGYSMERCAVTSLLWIDDDGMEMQ